MGKDSWAILNHLIEDYSDNRESFDLENEQSCLGGRIEGVVVKFINDNSRHLAFKYVLPSYRETKSKKVENKTGYEFFNKTVLWDKAIAFCKDNNLLKNVDKDIGIIISYLNKDFMVENKNLIKEILFQKYQ